MKGQNHNFYLGNQGTQSKICPDICCDTQNGSATLKFWIKIKALLIPKTISFIQGLKPHLQKLNPIENSPHPDHNDHSPHPPSLPCIMTIYSNSRVILSTSLVPASDKNRLI